jgi:hypothetical protein
VVEEENMVRSYLTSKRQVMALVLIGVVLSLWGCYESSFPLGSPEAGNLDAAILGTWRCVQGGEKENKSFLITAMPFDEKQYYVGLDMEGEKAIHYRAFSSAIKGTTLLNLQELDPKTVTSERKWIFIRYTFLRPNILQVELVKDEAFKGIDPSPSAVREVVEKKIASPELYQDFCLCTRVGEKK